MITGPHVEIRSLHFETGYLALVVCAPSFLGIMMLLRHDQLHGQKDVLSILALTGLPTRTRKSIHTL